MALDQKDLELIERMIYKNSDDIAISISRSFERLEERLDAAESRILPRLEGIRQDFVSRMLDLQDEVRATMRVLDAE